MPFKTDRPPQRKLQRHILDLDTDLKTCRRCGLELSDIAFGDVTCDPESEWARKRRRERQDSAVGQALGKGCGFAVPLH